MARHIKEQTTRNSHHCHIAALRYYPLTRTQMARRIKEQTTRNSGPYMILQVMNIGDMLLAKQGLVVSRVGSQRLVKLSSQFHQGSRNNYPRNEPCDAGHQSSNMKPHTWVERRETLRKRGNSSRRIRTPHLQQLSQHIMLTNRSISTTSQIYLKGKFSLTKQALIYIESGRSVQLEVGRGHSRISFLQRETPHHRHRVWSLREADGIQHKGHGARSRRRSESLHKKIRRGVEGCQKDPRGLDPLRNSSWLSSPLYRLGIHGLEHCCIITNHEMTMCSYSKCENFAVFEAGFGRALHYSGNEMTDLSVRSTELTTTLVECDQQ